FHCSWTRVSFNPTGPDEPLVNIVIIIINLPHGPLVASCISRDLDI
ncbi:hypothetical protein LINPERPRIM_LOCUS36978, partial [Linum perenne]